MTSFDGTNITTLHGADKWPRVQQERMRLWLPIDCSTEISKIKLGWLNVYLHTLSPIKCINAYLKPLKMGSGDLYHDSLSLKEFW